MGTRSYEFAKHFVRQGHQVTMLTGDSSLPDVKAEREGAFYRRYTLDGITVIAVKNRYSNYMGFIRRAISFFTFVLFSSIIGLAQKGHDVVLATSTPLTVAIPALLIKKINKIPFVFEVRDLWPEAPIQIGAIRSPALISLLQALERKTYREAEHIVALSPGMQKGVIAAGVDPQKVTVIPNCSDLDLFSEANIEADALTAYKEKYGLDGKLVVLHGGAMGIANGLEYVIEAANLLHKQNEQGIAILLAGDGKTKPQLEALCRQHGLSNVIFTGAIPRKEMPLLLAVSDITITSFKNLPILATNSPNKFFDSLAAAKPVVVNSAGWTKELVEKYQAGFYVDAEKPEELASLLVNVRDGQYDLREMGKRARRLAEEQYERIQLAKQMEAVLVRAACSSQMIAANRRVSQHES